MNQLRQANTGYGGWATAQRHQHYPHDEGSAGLRHLDTPDPTDEVWDETIALLAGELVALRTRLAAIEAAVGRPGPVGAPAPPTLPALARRIATLERQAGIVPGLDLLAGTQAAPTARPAVTAPEPPTRGQVWRDRGQAALAALVVLAVFAWLWRPAVPRAHPAPPAATATSAPTAVATVPIAGAANAAQPARDTRCDGPASEVCAGNDGRLATPAALTGDTPCALGGAAPCSSGGVNTETTAPPAKCFAPVGAAGEDCGSAAPATTITAGATWTVALTAVPPCAGADPEATCPHDAPFAPATLIIQVGDTVVWQVTSGQHTITFPAVGTPAPSLYLIWPGEVAGELNPLAAEPQGGGVYDGTALAGSGVLDEYTPVYRLTFPRPGHYVYVDLEHPGLVGDVIVLPADQPTASQCGTAC